MVLSAELSVAVLFVDSCFDCSELRVEESVVVSVVVEKRDVVLLSVGGVWGIGRRPVWVCPSSFCALGNGLMWCGTAFRSDYSQWEKLNI